MAKRKEPGKPGRPLALKTVEEVEAAITAYRNSTYAYMRDKSGEVVIGLDGNPVLMRVKPFTMAGLAHALGVSRMTILNYSNRDKFFDTISRAREETEVYSEEQLYNPAARGAQFALVNNHPGWSNRQDVGITADDITITLTGNADSD